MIARLSCLGRNSRRDGFGESDDSSFGHVSSKSECLDFVVLFVPICMVKSSPESLAADRASGRNETVRQAEAGFRLLRGSVGLV